MLRRIRSEMTHIARELIVEEGLCILTGAVDQRQMNKRCDDRRVAGTREFGRKIAEVIHQSVFNSCAGRAKEFLPIRVHRFLFP